MTLRVLGEAEAEIEAARQYLNAQSTAAGSAFLGELARALDAVAARPLSFAKLETLPIGQPYRRALLERFRYAVVFEVLADEIVIVAITHASREPNYWFGRPQ